MAKWISINYRCTRALNSFSIYCARSLPRLPSAAQGHIYTIHPTLPLSITDPHSTYFHQHPPSYTVLIHSFHVSNPSISIHTLSSTLHVNSFSVPALVLIYLGQILSIRDTPTQLLKHFISRTFTFLLSALLIPQASAPYNAVGTITSSYTLLRINPQSSIARHTSQRHTLYPSFILCPTSLSHPPAAATCDPIYWKQSTSSNGLSFSLICIRPTFTNFEHLWALLLPTLSLNFLLWHTLPNSLMVSTCNALLC